MMKSHSIKDGRMGLMATVKKTGECGPIASISLDEEQHETFCIQVSSCAHHGGLARAEIQIEVERGTRVHHVEPSHSSDEKTGTITHLPGDPPNEQHINGYEFPGDVAWVEYDQGREGWAELCYLFPLKQGGQDES
jgi:hypothetical protein